MFENTNLDLVLLGISFLISVFVVFKNPELFWYLLVFFSILGAGPAIEGYAIIDEIFLGSILIGSFLVLMRDGIKFDFDKFSKLHFCFFICFLSYLFWQSVRGGVQSGDARMLRYVVYFLELIALVTFIALKNFPIPPAEKLGKWVILCVAFYFIFYLAHGYYHEQHFGVFDGRFLTQGHTWSGSAYAVYPMTIGLTALILWQKKTPNFLWFLSLMSVVCAAVYFDSRTALILLFIFLLLSQSIRLIFIELSLMVLLLSFIAIFFPSHLSPLFENLVMKMNSLTESALFLISPRDSDLDRQQFLLAGWKTVQSQWSSLLFGSGFYSYRSAMVAALDRMGAQMSLSGIIRPTGVPALLVDTGLVGIGLLCLNLFLSLYTITFCLTNISRYQKFICSFALLVSVSWLAISNILDMVLLFVLIMPSGLICLLGQQSTKER